MASLETTRLRYVYSKDVEKLVQFCSELSFKIEIKGAPVFQGGKWFLFFILPENEAIEFKSGSIEL